MTDLQKQAKEAVTWIDLKIKDMDYCSGLVRQGNQFVPKQMTPLRKALGTVLDILNMIERGELRGVVCCEDCEFCRAGSECHYRRDDNGRPDSVMPNDFCSYGRRKSDG